VGSSEQKKAPAPVYGLFRYLENLSFSSFPANFKVKAIGLGQKLMSKNSYVNE